MKRGNPRQRAERQARRAERLQTAVDTREAERLAAERRLARRITARKYMGDDSESWAVFLDGRPAYTGMNRRSVPYYRGLVLDLLKKEGK